MAEPEMCVTSPQPPVLPAPTPAADLARGVDDGPVEIIESEERLEGYNLDVLNAVLDP